MAGLGSPSARFASYVVLLSVLLGVALVGRPHSASTLPEQARAVATEPAAASPEDGDALAAARHADDQPSSRGGPRDAAPEEMQPDGPAAVDGAAVNLLDAGGTLAVGQQLIVPGGRSASPATGTKAEASASSGGQSKAAPSTETRVAATPAPADRGTSAGDAEPRSGSSRAGAAAPVTTAQVVAAIDANPAHWAFIQAAIGPAQESQRETGVPASVTIGQAIHESAWGASRLSREGNNYFGIKASGQPGPRGVIRMGTWEHIDGANVTVIDGFRAYNNMAESFVDHGRFLVENKRYATAMANLDDPRVFIRLVAQAGYATDPNYTRKVLAYMDRYNLYQYDLDY